MNDLRWELWLRGRLVARAVDDGRGLLMALRNRWPLHAEVRDGWDGRQPEPVVVEKEVPAPSEPGHGY